MIKTLFHQLSEAFYMFSYKKNLIMFKRSLISLVIIIVILIAFIYCNYSSIESNFEFDLKNLNNTQRNRLFDYLDKNRDNCLSKNELRTLLRQLFYS